MGRENYLLGYSDEWQNMQRHRLAAVDASHILRFIERDSHVLDVGCGPASIILDIAELVPEGHATGVDVVGDQFDQARTSATKRGLVNLTLQQGDAYKLPFDDESFDIVYETYTLMHLAEPEKAVAEMKRVLKPGGCIGVRDSFTSARTFYGSSAPPVDDGQQKMNAVLVEIGRQNGGDWDLGVKHRGMLKSAGFLDVDLGQSAAVMGNDNNFALMNITRAGTTVLTEMLFKGAKQGLVTTAEVEAWEEWVAARQNDPAAVIIWPHIYATGRKP
jgi:hypothetical protein